MTVEELIHVLGQYDPGAEVIVGDDPYPVLEVFRNDRGQVVIW